MIFDFVWILRHKVIERRLKDCETVKRRRWLEENKLSWI